MSKGRTAVLGKDCCWLRTPFPLLSSVPPPRWLAVQPSSSLVRRAPFIDPNNQSLNVYIAVDNTYGDLYDGLYLKAAISGKYVEEGMLIERSVIRNKNEVFIVASDSLLQTKKINIAKITENDAIIHGLDPGELIVVDAPSNASNNMVVEIVNEVQWEQ